MQSQYEASATDPPHVCSLRQNTGSELDAGFGLHAHFKYSYFLLGSFSLWGSTLGSQERQTTKRTTAVAGVSLTPLAA